MWRPAERGRGAFGWRRQVSGGALTDSSNRNGRASDRPLPLTTPAFAPRLDSWQVTTGNSFGTICGWQSYMADSRFPTMDGSTGVTSIDYNEQGLTGTIPTQVRVVLVSVVLAAQVGAYACVCPIDRCLLLLKLKTQKYADCFVLSFKGVGFWVYG